MTQKERMEKGLVYDPGDAEILAEQAALCANIRKYNECADPGIRAEMLKEMLAECGEGCYVEPPFYANWGGAHVHFGNNVYANFGLTAVDDGHIYVGDNVMFGPHVTIATANHPISPEHRRRGLQYNKDIRIGNNVWIGAGAVIVPGVSIGADSVIGAGAVVTSDIPEGVVAVGVPCRVIRRIGERDLKYFYKDEELDI